MVAIDTGPTDLEELGTADLSPWFNPFLVHFAREARRCGGEARVVREGGTITGFVVSDPVERVATVFTRSVPVAEAAVRGRGPYGMYSDVSFDPTAEPFAILSVSLRDSLPSHRFRHFVRPFGADDRLSVLDLMREVYGAVNERWFEGFPTQSEAGFVVEVGRRIAGVGWVTQVGSHARLHSLTVRPPFRRMGLGTDLLFSRLLWAQRAGAGEVVSEISEENVGSLAIAQRGGMRAIGRIYFHRPL